MPFTLIVGACHFATAGNKAISLRSIRAYQTQGWLRGVTIGGSGRDLCSGDRARGHGAIPALHLFQVLTDEPARLLSSMIRAAFCMFLLCCRWRRAWNLGVAPSHPALAIKIGPKLGGVTCDAPVDLSWSSLRDGSFQKAVASRVTDAMPIRPLLIRVNNEIRFELFGELTAPQVVRGAKGN